MSWRWSIVGALASLGVMGSLALGLRDVAGDLSTPRDLHGAAHATSAECQRCHPAQFESWHRTFHRTMTQEATDGTVLGDFAGASFTYGGIEARMSRGEDGSFRMRFVGPGGEIARAEVVRTVGSRRVQQYLAREGDLFFRLPVAWHVEEGRWFHMNGAFLTPDPVGLDEVVDRADYNRHVTRWNDNCVFCHNVAANPGWRPGPERWDTEVAELGIACEACHGPAEEHAAVNANPLRRYALHLSGDADPTIVNPARLSPEASAAVCGRCHGQRITDDVSRFLERGDPYVPGDELTDYSRPLARDTPLDGDRTSFAARFWPDGTARLTAYEYQGLLLSPCEGLTCIDCHGMHEGDPRGQIRPDHEGVAACTGCHAPDGHARHASVECADCHMPRIVYGLIGVHRSHRIEVPDPWDASRPDACSLCHADRAARWLQRGYARWWGRPEGASEDASEVPRVYRDAFAGDPIERAVAVAALGREEGLREGAGPARAGILLDTMSADPYPAVRRIAHRSLVELRGAPEDFVPTAPEDARRRWVHEAQVVPVEWPDEERVAAWRAEASEVAIFIGE